MTKRLALNTNGDLTFCTASEENIGKGRCNHVDHQKSNESNEDFLKRIDEKSKAPDLPSETKQKEVLDNLINNKRYDVRLALVEQQYRLDLLAEDEDRRIRLKVMELNDEIKKAEEIGFLSKPKPKLEDMLDNLINHAQRLVRASVAEQGYGLDQLVNDKEADVRDEVARHGYGLDVLVNDEDEEIRRKVAEQGYGLDILINDKSWKVRMEVAKQGYELDKLVDDKEREIKLEVIRRGYGLDKLALDEDWKIKAAAVKQMVRHPKSEFGDPAYNSNSIIREEAARQGYKLEKLINDESYEVRAAVAKRGYGLETLIYDKDWQVRQEVARKGFGLDSLINDTDQFVRLAAERSLKRIEEDKLYK